MRQLDRMETESSDTECLGDIIAEDEGSERDPRVWKRLDRGCWYREKLEGAE